jgi:hypothetical protein
MFYRLEYVGAATICGGVVIALLPSLLEEGTYGDKVLFNLIYMASSLPAAFSVNHFIITLDIGSDWVEFVTIVSV